MTDQRRTILDDMTDAERKAVPLELLLDYFPNVLIEVARIIADGQVQHGTTGWDRSKSNNHRGSLMRHLLQWGTMDGDGRSHTAKVAIRALMAGEIELEPKPHARRNCPAGKSCSVCKAQRDALVIRGGRGRVGSKGGGVTKRRPRG